MKRVDKPELQYLGDPESIEYALLSIPFSLIPDYEVKDTITLHKWFGWYVMINHDDYLIEKIIIIDVDQWPEGYIKGKLVLKSDGQIFTEQMIVFMNQLEIQG